MIFVILLLFILVQGVFAEDACTLVRMWGSHAGGSSTTANGVAADASGNVYVTDTGNNQVQRYSPEGSIVTYWDLTDTETGQSGVPYGIAVDSSHNVYITDSKNNTVQKLTTRGSQAVWGSEGTGDGQFSHPTGIAVDSSGNVYVADTGNNRIQKFHSTGTYLMQWGSYGTPEGIDGQFNTPKDVTVDAYGHVFVADTGNNRIQKFSPDGTFLAKWGSSGTGDGQFSAPAGIAVDSGGNIYVTDLTTRIQKFNTVGEFLSACNTSGSNSDVAVDPSGTMYALLQSGSQWKVGVYRTTASIPTQTSPVKRHTKFEITTPGVPATLQNSAPRTTIPVTPVTTAPATEPVTIATPGLTSTTGDNATMAAPTDYAEETIRNSESQEDILNRITRFFRDLFGGYSPAQRTA